MGWFPLQPLALALIGVIGLASESCCHALAYETLSTLQSRNGSEMVLVTHIPGLHERVSQRAKTAALHTLGDRVF